MFFRRKTAKGHTYVQLVESFREAGKSRQRVLLTLGSLEELRHSGRLDALLQSGSRLSESLLFLSENELDGLASTPPISLGPSLSSNGSGRRRDAAMFFSRRAKSDVSPSRSSGQSS